MLDLQIRSIDDKVFLVRFCLSSDDVNKLIEDFELLTGKSFLNDDVENWEVLEGFERDFFVHELNEHGFKEIGPLHFRYLSNLTYNKKLLGVCRFISSSEVFNVEIPTEVNKNSDKKILSAINNKEQAFNYTLLKRGLYYEQASKKVNWFGKIDYELRYIENGKTIDVIKNQHFDMLEDDDIDGSILIGAKIGDFVVLQEEPIVIGALIQNITNRFPYSEEQYDFDVITPIFESFKIRSFTELKEKLFYEYEIECARRIYFDDIINQMVKNVDYEVSDEEIKFFDEEKDAPYQKEYIDTDNKEKKQEIIKKQLLIYYLSELYSNTMFDDFYQVDRAVRLLSLDNNSRSDVYFTINKIIYNYYFMSFI